MESNAQSKPSWKERLQQIGRMKGLTEVWTGVIANQAMQHHQNEVQKNRDAESAYVRKNVWGDASSSPDTGGDDMSHQTILGDVTQAPPTVVMAGGDSGLKTLATLAIGGLMGLSGAGVAGAAAYSMLNGGGGKDAATPSAPNLEDTNLKLGLGRIEDFFETEKE